MYTAHILVMPTGKYLLFLFFVINIKTHLSKNNINCCWSLESRYQEKWKKSVCAITLFSTLKNTKSVFLLKNKQKMVFLFIILFYEDDKSQVIKLIINHEWKLVIMYVVLWKKK